MSFSLSEISTVQASFAKDLDAYRAAGFDGIGIWESKLGDGDADLDAFAASGLRATNCVPLVPSILPNTVVPGPEDVEERIESMCGSMHRLARFEPDCVLCLTGPGGEDDGGTIVDGLRRVAAAAEDAGVRLGLEPIHASQRDALSVVTTIPEALALLEAAGLPQVGIMVDLWHVGDTPASSAAAATRRRPSTIVSRSSSPPGPVRQSTQSGSNAASRCSDARIDATRSSTSSGPSMTAFGRIDGTCGTQFVTRRPDACSVSRAASSSPSFISQIPIPSKPAAA